jgi:hypothetical protein
MGGQRRACAAIVLFCALTAGCATDAGGGISCEIPEEARLVAAPDGGMLVEWPNGTSAILTFANGTCGYTRPPVAPARSVIAESELGFTYDYYRLSLAPCLDSMGFRVLAPPTRQAFIESGGNWSPYDAVSSTMLSSDELATLAKVCPRGAPAS